MNNPGKASQVAPEHVLLVGGGGFIGSNVARSLLKDGHQVTIFDSFFYPFLPMGSNHETYVETRLNDLKDRCQIIVGDVRSAAQLRRAFHSSGATRAIYLAALPVANVSHLQSEEAFGSIVQGCVNCLEIVRDIKDFRRFVYISSSMIYGDFDAEPCAEDHPKRPKDLYGAAKLAGEVMVGGYGRRLGVPWTVVRPSAVYGPTDVNRRVSQLFVESAFQGRPLVLEGEGKTRLDFTYIEDITEGMILATFSERAASQEFNITCGNGRSLAEFAEILKEWFPKLQLEVKKDVADFRPRRGSLDISKARELLGYQPKHQLEDGLRKYVDFVSSTNLYRK